MKNLMKILTRYVLSAAGVALILLVVNFAALITWTTQSGKTVRKNYDIAQIADSLLRSDGGYTLPETARNKIETNRQWAMLIDNNSGTVIWSLNQPSEVPQSYTVSDVAGFTRWYLNGYPVTVWKHPDGLFVLGNEKDSVWKYCVTEPMAIMDNAGVWIIIILILNSLVAVLLALLFGLRLFRSLKPLAKGIEDMAEKRPVELSTCGLLGDLAAGINDTSAQLKRQEAALSKRDNARTTWIAGISHDIRTPLSIVMGYSNQLEEDAELPQSKREQAGIIRRQSERIKTLVSDLSLASKLEYDMQPIRRSEIALAALLRQTAVDFLNSGLSDSYDLDVIIKEDAQNAMISGDEELLRRAVSNLIANCIQHNPNGCAIKVTLEKTLGNCSLTVSDNGVGFKQEMLDDLNHPKNSARLENHGLGLTIVRQIIKAHGGITKFYNLAEGGCTVVLSLP
ncbi:sensor histidine kinase [Anaerotignum sp.]|uniref:sensor histidine kinase n=1 Tax=Anaerotignum sp. TaxID=2039241 RepID=UPI00271479FE|nr:HAMP domain-containing sensor histidine kinase [Anaerotignum sp.]